MLRDTDLPDFKNLEGLSEKKQINAVEKPDKTYTIPEHEEIQGGLGGICRRRP